MNLKDRGNKKWTAMMLIEHRKKLKELKEHENDREKPILDDQEKEAINNKIIQAANKNLKVKIEYHHNKRFHIIIGYIKNINQFEKKIFISDENNKLIKIKLNDIIDLSLL
jgi:sugar diacid utilization regulator